MGAQVRTLLLAQLLVRVEIARQGELRRGLPAQLGVMGEGWGAWRPKGAHFLSYPQRCGIGTCCFQVRRPGDALPCAGHLSRSANGDSSFPLPAPGF